MTTARNVIPLLVTGTWCPRDKGTTKFNQKNAKSEHIEAQTDSYEATEQEKVGQLHMSIRSTLKILVI